MVKRKRYLRRRCIVEIPWHIERETRQIEDSDACSLEGTAETLLGSIQTPRQDPWNLIDSVELFGQHSLDGYRHRSRR